MSFQVLQGDCREVLKTLLDSSVDSCVTDPPYHLTQVSRAGSPRNNDPETPFGRTRIGERGFMGKVWDGGDVAHDPAVWLECLRVIKPGGHLLAFGGSRTYHRLACAIEDAGFEIRDQIMWLYGSGFPKSLNLDNGVGTGLKPAHEPIVLARKPLIGTVATNIAQYGTGGLNIEICRVDVVDGQDYAANFSGDRGHDGTRDAAETAATNMRMGGGKRPLLAGDYKETANNTYAGRMDGSLAGGSKAVGETELGRWPANILHDGSGEVLTAFPNAPGQQRALNGTEAPKQGTPVYGDYGPRPACEPRLDSGSAARFFYCSKASQQDRDEGLEDAIRRQRDDGRKEGKPGGDNPRNRGVQPRANHHPTVKPTDLMRYLCRLVTPPGGTVLDPFCGSGSTGKAAVLESLSFIGIELSDEYVELAERRIAAATKQGLLW